MGIGDVVALLTGVAAVLTAAGASAKGIAELVKVLRKEKRERPDQDEQVVDESA